MTNSKREKLKAAYKLAADNLAKIEAVRKELLAPTQDEWWAAVMAEGDAEEALDESTVGRCETCNEIIFDGDKYLSYEDAGIYLCEIHAPTVGDRLDELLAAGKTAHEWFEDGQEAYDACVANLKSRPRDESLAS